MTTTLKWIFSWCGCVNIMWCVTCWVNCFQCLSLNLKSLRLALWTLSTESPCNNARDTGTTIKAHLSLSLLRFLIVNFISTCYTRVSGCVPSGSVTEGKWRPTFSRRIAGMLCSSIYYILLISFHFRFFVDSVPTPPCPRKWIRPIHVKVRRVWGGMSSFFF